MRPLLLLGALGLLLAAPPARAHDLHHSVEQREAVVLRLVTGHDHPFGGQTYEITRVGEETAAQTGRTDEAGRIVFLPPGPGRYRCRGFSADGHGADFTFAVEPSAPAPAGETAADTLAVAATPASDPVRRAGPDRSSRIVLGAGILLSLFGFLSLAAARRARPE